jgi:hypothetical protein
MALDQAIRVMENNSEICNGHSFFFDISDKNFRPVQSFSYHITFSKDGNPRCFAITNRNTVFESIMAPVLDNDDVLYT